MISLFILVALAVMIIAVLAWHHVPKRPTAEDRIYAQKVLSAAGSKVRMAAQCCSLGDEIAVFKEVQRAVLAASPASIGIPKRQPREPRDLFERGHGLCYDRSRSIEKILSTLGFTNRHAALLAVADGAPRMQLIAEGIPTHHVTEVLSQGGWILLDSNTTWLGSADSSECVGLLRLSGMAADARQTETADPLLSMEFIYIYGLYARHGEFYPPYNFLPDINWIEFLIGFPGLMVQLWVFLTHRKVHIASDQ